MVKIESYKSRFTLLDVHGTRATNVVGCLEGTLDDLLRTSMTLNGNKNSFYDRFGVIPWLHHKIINGWLDDIVG